MSSQATSMPADAAPSGSSCEISWPTIFFWMLSLAINSAAQPTGRILGTSYRHQSILRSSPIICAFDAIHALASWVTFTVSPIQPPAPDTLSIRLAATRILLPRFSDENGNLDSKPIQSFKAQSRVRWIAFVSGTLPQAIKLFAATGVPWSKAFGAMYLVSWLLFEILFLVAKLDPHDIRYIGTLPRSGTSLIQSIWAGVAWRCHALLYCLPMAAAQGLTTTFDKYLTTIMMYLVFSVPWEDCFSTNLESAFGRLSFSRLLLGALVGVVYPLHHLFLHKYISGASYSDSPWFFILSAVYTGALVFLFLFGGRWEREVGDILRVWNIIMQPVFFYGSIYDPVGTCQPRWLQWLG